MAKIIAPNHDYNGVSASVSFRDGVGETKDKYLITWFKEHGYSVEESEPEPEPESEPESESESEPEPEVEQVGSTQTKRKPKSKE